MVSENGSGKMMNRLHAVVLAGGAGTRLWPMSRSAAPKQMMTLGGDQSLLSATIQRLVGRVPPERMLLVTGEDIALGIRAGLAEALGRDADRCRLISEPVGRNTAPAVLLATLLIHRRDPSALVLVTPSDHLIQDPCAFHEAIDHSLDAAAQGNIVTYGITPTHPETGYGYIRLGRRSGRLFLVDRFEEKPDLSKARRFFRQKRHLWNSGIFLFGASTMIVEARRHLPRMMEAFESLDLEDLGNLKEVYGGIPSISIDRGVMEKTDRAMVLPVNMGWNDVGSWDAVYAIEEKDGQRNVVRGRAVCPDTSGSLVLSSGRLLAVVGVDGLVVVDTSDALLVCRRGSSQDVRKAVDLLRAEDTPELSVHTTVQRPWGTYTVLEEGRGYKIKRIVVLPGAKLSLQSHRRRSEHWVVVRGEARVTRAGETYPVKSNESTFIPMGTIHRLENPGAAPLEIIEVQNGDYVAEDDIQRYDDAYGRPTSR